MWVLIPPPTFYIVMNMEFISVASGSEVVESLTLLPWDTEFRSSLGFSIK